ncbi:sigma-54-dependent Fis family transcriptional regulator [candidate division WOR-3 bacterium]|uniref:Sigma-54-dependent Fis family transcriptional regulator n=1 Tax=candidate division WOR-3 bacterium TaxID=2052148 RepID=A0A937XFY4_UNCW3|nr:sigma-54-dependent Fis family transcriptional regulator [candidate division WOR-3 bacterium]
MRHRVLVADDDKSVAQVVKFLLEEEGHDVVVVGSLSEAREQFRHQGQDPNCLSAIRSCPSFDLVVTDLKLPDGTGLDVLRLVKEASPDVPVVLITAFATVNTAVEAMKLGAFDYVQKPFDNDRLKGLVANALRLRDLKIENTRLRDEVVGRHGLSAIVGASPQMEKVREMVRLAAKSDAAVMVLGETGTGKELVARAIHFLGQRAAKPFVAVNCGAIPENLVESELFGHKKGSFTGATSDRDGRFAQADAGTIFLDEVTEMKRDLQVKLLRAIEAREIQPVGSTDTLKVDVRIISATNRDPMKCVREGEFREDLYYRLNVFTLPIPQLREHRQDIPELVASYLVQRGYGPEAVSKEALELLAEHDFPGNVRELQNVIESGLILSGGKPVVPEDIAERLMPQASGLKPQAPSIPDDGLSLADVERSHLEAALKKTGGNQSQAARLLGISRATLIYRMKKHGLM